jgi:hypothetical protein
MSNLEGRPPFTPTDDQRELVRVMTASGFPQPEIATKIGIDPKTLRKHFRAEIKTGKQTANAMVAQSLFNKAIGTGHQSVAAAIFWLKTQARWREAHLNEGEPLPQPKLKLVISKE